MKELRPAVRCEEKSCSSTYICYANLQNRVSRTSATKAKTKKGAGQNWILFRPNNTKFKLKKGSKRAE